MKTTGFGLDRGLDYPAVEQKLVAGLKNYCENSGQHGYVIGVSGGVDSAVVSTLCAKSGLPLIVLSLPIHQKSAEVDRAKDHIDRLKNKFSNVTDATIDLTTVYEAYKKATQDGLQAMEEGDIKQKLLGQSDADLPYVNLRSRNRAGELYLIAGALGYLVAGTGNKIEDFFIGFFTKFGDGAVDVSPIGELFKSEVRKLGAHMGVIASILEAAPTDGLHPNGATDEDQIKATYDELEWAYDQLFTINDHLHTEELLYDVYDTPKYATLEDALRQFPEGSREQKIITIGRKRHHQNGHKMTMPPRIALQ